MATLDSLKKALREKGTATSSTTPPLSDSQCLHGFSILARGSTAYQDFIVPQLAQLAPLVNSDSPISVLEIGPGPKSILGYLPEHLRKKIGKYSALEPNKLFVSQLRDWLNESLPCLGSPPDIRQCRFDLSRVMHHLGKFDLIVFCHSMYGMIPKRSYIRHALGMLVDGGLVVVFHRENPTFDGLVCQQTASFPTGVTRMLNDSAFIDFFAPFIAGFQAPALRLEWRKICRDLGRREESNLVFASPEIMVTFNKHATAVPGLMSLVPSLKERTIKNQEAHPDNEDDLLWALKGAGTNFGIVIRVTFMAHAAPTYLVQNWIPSLTPGLDMQFHLDSLNVAAKGLPRECSDDGYLFYQDNELRLGVTTFDTEQVPRTPVFGALFGPEIDSKLVNGVELFDNEMYMSKMHGGHGGGKTSSFKRCIFLKGVGDVKTADILVDVVKNRPSPLCYLHLLHGGEAVSDVAETATAFGCRDWMFACVITAVWPCDQDGTATAREAMQWVYDVAGKLLPLSAGAYGADLGPDPRDKALAAWAFGPNRARLAELKHRLDPGNVLAYACPLLEPPKQKLVILVTGESGSGKDYCADIWASVFVTSAVRARAFSISDKTKREYAAATGSDLGRLLSDRDYKEEHRPALTEFFEDQLKKRTELLKEHFLKAMKSVADVDVLMITGMRDEAPLITFSPLFPDIKMIEVRVQTSDWIRRIRRGRGCQDDSDSSEAKGAATFTFDNDTNGIEKAEAFAKRHLLPLFHEDLERLAGIVPTIPDYPTLVDFRHVLNIVSSPKGLTLCTSLLKTHFTGDWDKVDVIASCEAGGFLFASPLAQQLEKPLVPIRKAGKLPPPVVMVSKSSSHISSLVEHYETEKGIEMNPDLVSDGVSVVVVDDVLASGTTLCAVLRLLYEAGARVENISVMVVAEFPYHRGRGTLKKHGFGSVNIQSLLVFGGA